MSDIKKIANLIKDQTFEKIELGIKKPNIFNILKISKAEIRHSNFLAWLFDPKGNHGLGKIFINKFLRDVFSDDKIKRNQVDADLLNYDNVEIRREWKNIDLLLILNDDVVTIENKIDTEDSYKQLSTYKGRIENVFPDKSHKHFIYLTPFGNDPKEEAAKDAYVNYSYDKIINNLEKVLDVYGESMNELTKIYIIDYILTIRREIMQNDTLNNMAKELYNVHKDALDFIFENKPDIYKELYPYFEDELINNGLRIGSKNKHYIRFTTVKLDTLLPRLGNGWKEKEIFLFELAYTWNNDITFDFAISPGNDSIRKILSEAIEADGFVRNNYGDWIIYGVNKWPFNSSEIINKEEKEIKETIKSFIPKMMKIVKKVEDAILAKKPDIIAVLNSI